MVTGIPSILAYIKGNESFASDFAYGFSGGKDALKTFFDTVNIPAWHFDLSFDIRSWNSRIDLLQYQGHCLGQGRQA